MSFARQVQRNQLSKSRKAAKETVRGQRYKQDNLKKGKWIKMIQFFKGDKKTSEVHKGERFNPETGKWTKENSMFRKPKRPRKHAKKS